jgi:hypothetical protein
MNIARRYQAATPQMKKRLHDMGILFVSVVVFVVYDWFLGYPLGGK